MRSLLAGGRIFRKGRLRREDVLVDGDRIAAVGSSISIPSETQRVDCSKLLIVPGFVDVHVHLREPGFLMKETMKSGTLAAARGGYTCVCAMPNLDPVPDSVEHLWAQLRAIQRDACVKVLPYGAITKGEKGETLADLEALGPSVVGFTDDGRGVQRGDLMREAMVRAKALGRPICSHCEDDDLRGDGCIHDGPYARAAGIAGIPPESEWRQVERDLALVREAGCRYHALHVSTKEGVALIRRAKAEGLPVSCETAPHYLTLCEDDLQDEGRFKMNPPLRGAADRDALVEGLLDGTIDLIATDHAPHTEKEKSGGLRGSVMGIVGLETALPVLYTKLVLAGTLSLEALLGLMCDAPRRWLGQGPGLEPGEPADLAVLDLDTPYAIHSGEFLSMGRSTPFEGWPVYGRCVSTFVDGKRVWDEGGKA